MWKMINLLEDEKKLVSFFKVIIQIYNIIINFLLFVY